MRVLVTTDGSRRSLQALPHAVRATRALGGELVLARVIDPQDAGTKERNRPAPAMARVARQRKRHLEQKLEEVPVPARPVLLVRERREKVADLILRLIEEEQVDLAVLATHGAGFIRTAMLGSVATAVLRRASVPVMLVGPKVQAPADPLPYHLLVTTDGSPAAASVLPSMKMLLRQAPRDRVRLTLLRVCRAALGDPTNDVLHADCERQLATFQRQAPRRFHISREVRDDHSLRGVDHVIAGAAAELGADAIWMATHGASFRRRALLGSAALAMVRRANVPVVLSSATG